MNRILRFRDTTDHGGSVIESIPHTNLNDKPMAGKGNLVMCISCKGGLYTVVAHWAYAVRI